MALIGLLPSLSLLGETDVFVSGALDANQPYSIFRIPSLCRSSKGSLLAFAEARQSIGDQSSNIIVLRRLAANASTWSPLEVVARDGTASLNNPCVLPTKAGIWLMYQRYPQGFNEFSAKPGFDPDSACQTFVVSSRDDGRTWSKPVDISPAIKGPETRSDAVGPGVGIELKVGTHAGRFVFPFNEGAGGHYTAFSVISDDKGRSWRRSSPLAKAPGTEPNECQVVELSDGTLMLNARNQARDKCRLVATSSDGGESWSMAALEPSLPDPTCMGSIARLSYRPNKLLFSNSASSARRVHGCLRMSHDDGKTWSVIEDITGENSSFEYSCLCPLNKTTISILYETREITPEGKEGYRIRFKTIQIPNSR